MAIISSGNSEFCSVRIDFIFRRYCVIDAMSLSDFLSPVGIDGLWR